MSAMRECVSIPHGGLFFVSWPFSIVPASLLGRWEKLLLLSGKTQKSQITLSEA